PGNYEVRLGTPFAKLLEMAGGMRAGRKLKAVIPGGSSMPVLPHDIIMKTDMDYDSIAKAGSMLGSGAVIVMDDTTCMVRALERLSYFYFEESCGQCTPCREGTGWLYRVVNRIENGPKPLPACATPHTDCMKVCTHSTEAKKAQNGVMEFLLINHPPDRPICDQGGECQLQDLAVGYGHSSSRYDEEKRVVSRKELGPLVAAEEMSRCIQCTRCVRFGQEVAGVMEL